MRDDHGEYIERRQPERHVFAARCSAAVTLPAVNACAAGNGNNDTIDLSLFARRRNHVLIASSADASLRWRCRRATDRGNLDVAGNPLLTITRSRSAARRSSACSRAGQT